MLVAAVLSATSGSSSRTLDVTWSKGAASSGGCQNGQANLFCVNLAGPVDYDLVRINVDCHGTCDVNALGCSAGASGRIARTTTGSVA